MKNLSLFISLLLMINFVSEAQVVNSKDTAAKKQSTEKEMVFPYAIHYSAKFEPIDPQKGKMILDRWKDFENNQLDSWKEIFADTVAMWFPTTKMRASRDTIIARIKSYRNSYKSVKRQVDVVMPTRSADRKADFVLIWGNEKYTDEQNKSIVVELHEVWAFNKEGKIETIEQYIRR